MLLIKVDSNNHIIESPYEGDEFREILNNPKLLANTAWLPDNIISVDKRTHWPETIPWDQYPEANGQPLYDSVENTWYLTYNMADLYQTDEEKLVAIKIKKQELEMSNKNSFIGNAQKVLGKYRPEERESFAQQRKEAEAFQADNSVSTPMLTVIAEQRNITVSELAQKVLDKAIATDEEYGAHIGRYHKNKDLLASVDFDDDTTWDAVNQVEI